MKAQEIDETRIRPEITQIKGHLAHTDYFAYDKMKKETIHNSFVYVTGMTDERTFDKHLKQYIQHDYLEPLDKNNTFFKATEKFQQI